MSCSWHASVSPLLTQTSSTGVSLGGHYVALSKHSIAKITVKKAREGEVSFLQATTSNQTLQTGSRDSWDPGKPRHTERDRECSNENTVPPDIGMQA